MPRRRSQVFALVLIVVSLAGRGRPIQAQGVPPELDRAMLLEAAERNRLMRLDRSESDVPAQDRAAAAFVRGEPKRAFEILNAAHREDPDLPPPDVVLAKWYLMRSAAKNARVHLDRATTRDPTDPEAYLILAEWALDDGRLTEARLLFEKVLSLCPADKPEHETRK